MESILTVFVVTFVGILLAFLLGGFMGVMLLLLFKALAIVLYFVPTICALYKKHPSSLWIFLLNAFLGWTFIGWLVALLLAFDFDKTIKEFIEFKKAKASKAKCDCKNDDIIEGETVSE